MNRYLEKKIIKYVAATLDNPTLYLKKTPAKSEYCFVEDIEMATKSLNKKLMNQIISYNATNNEVKKQKKDKSEYAHCKTCSHH